MTGPRVALISAVARNGVIGRDNALPWRLSDDLKIFKGLTLNHAIIMGRKTWDSLGRPLPNRKHFVVTRQSALSIEGVTVVHSLAEAIAACADEEEIFVIGGAQLYGEALRVADRIYLSEVLAEVAGDTCFPAVNWQDFNEIRREHHAADERNEFAFDFVEYHRMPHT